MCSFPARIAGGIGVWALLSCVVAQAQTPFADSPERHSPERHSPQGNEEKTETSARAGDPGQGWQSKADALLAFAQGNAAPSIRVDEIFSLHRAEVLALLGRDGSDSLAFAVAGEKARLKKQAASERKKLQRRFGKRLAALKIQERWRSQPFVPMSPKEGEVPAPGDPLKAYVKAAATYFALPQARRDAIWRIYAQRPAALRPSFAEGSTGVAQGTQAELDALKQFIQGSADPKQNIEPLLSLDIRNHGALLWGDPQSQPAQDSLEDQAQRYYELDKAKRDALWQSYQGEREKFLAAQADVLAREAKDQAERERLAKEAKEAEQAAGELERQRLQALHAAQEAQSAAERLAASERARLLSIRGQQEAWSLKINQWRQESKALHDETMALVQAVAEYDRKELAPRMAQSYYEQIDAVLARARAQLKERLSESLAGSTDIAKDIEKVGPMPPLTTQKKEVEQLRFELLERANELSQIDRDVAWNRMTARHEDLMALNRARLSILGKLPSKSYSKYAGVSASGWQTVVDELSQMRLELTVRWLRLRRRVGQLAQELAESATAILWGGIQIAVLVLLFRWWRKRAHEVLVRARIDLLERRRDYPLVGKAGVLLWYLIRVRSPLEWWLLGWAVAQLWLTKEWVEVAILWTVYKWVVGGVLAVSLLNAFAVQGMRRKRGQKDHTRQLRTDTLRLICYTGTAMGLILALAEQLVGRGAFYGWVRNGAWIVYIPMAIYLLIRWKPTVYERCERVISKGPVPRWVVAQTSRHRSVLGTIVGAGYLIYHGSLRRASRLLMGLESVRRAAAFLLRREVMSNAQDAENGADYRPHPIGASGLFDPDSPAPEVLAIGPSSRIEGLISSLDEGRTALVAVVGGRGAGKSSFLSRLVTDSDERIFDLVIDCPPEGLKTLFVALEQAVGASLQDRSAFEAALDAKGARVLCVDNLHRLVRPTIGGLAELDAFLAFARGWSNRLSWVVAIEGSAWRYTKRARGNRVFFDEVISLRPWNEEGIVELLDARNRCAGLEPDFSTLKLSHPDEEFDLDDLDPQESQEHEELHSNRRKYYRILWEYSGGNPGVALHAWGRSLYCPSQALREPKAPECVVRVFPNPDLARIEKLSLPVLFTLRAIVQLELGTEAQIVECTNLAPQDCSDAIRVAIAAGYVYREGSWLRIHWDWHRAIVTVLVRQHLLADS